MNPDIVVEGAAYDIEGIINNLAGRDIGDVRYVYERMKSLRPKCDSIENYRLLKTFLLAGLESYLIFHEGG